VLFGIPYAFVDLLTIKLLYTVLESSRVNSRDFGIRNRAVLDYLYNRLAVTLARWISLSAIESSACALRIPRSQNAVSRFISVVVRAPDVRPRYLSLVRCYKCWHAVTAIPRSDSIRYPDSIFNNLKLSCYRF